MQPPLILALLGHARLAQFTRSERVADEYLALSPSSLKRKIEVEEDALAVRRRALEYVGLVNEGKLDSALPRTAVSSRVRAAATSVCVPG